MLHAACGCSCVPHRFLVPVYLSLAQSFPACFPVTETLDPAGLDAPSCWLLAQQRFALAVGTEPFQP